MHREQKVHIKRRVESAILLLGTSREGGRSHSQVFDFRLGARIFLGQIYLFSKGARTQSYQFERHNRHRFLTRAEFQRAAPI